MKWVITIINLVGTWLNARQKAAGYFIWLVCNCAWLTIDMHDRNYPRAILDVVNAGMCIYGMYCFEKERIKNDIRRG